MHRRKRSTEPHCNQRSQRLVYIVRVGRALVVTFAAAVLVASGVFYGLVYLLDFQEIDGKAKLDAATLFDLVKLSFGVVAGAGALVALVVAYRRQRVDDASAHREATRLHTERFSVAVGKLGSDSPAVRLGGVHALAGLADDAPDGSLRQTCIDVLCACLQLPFNPDPGDDPATDAPRGPAAPGRAATSTLPASPSTASWTSAALCSPAAWCPSTTRRVQPPTDFLPPSAVLLLHRSLLPPPG